MTESQLIEYLSTATGANKEEAKRFLVALPCELAEHLKQGKRINIRKLGIFYNRRIKNHLGLHPITRTPIKRPAIDLPHFRAGKILRNTLK